MKRRIPSLAIAGVLAAVPGSFAQLPPPPQPVCTNCPPPPQRGYTPLLYVRFRAPEGARVTAYQGPTPRAVAPADVIGLRPGYLYRVKVESVSRARPEAVLYPSLEVIGTLNLPATMNPANHPATIQLTDADVLTALNGGMVTKVVYLEHPDRSPPLAVPPGTIAEGDRAADSNLIEESKDLGRPVLVVRIGQRAYSEQELAMQSVPGTVLGPGDKGLAVPPIPPPLLWKKVRLLADPVFGYRIPDEECLHDGGDRGEPAGLDAGGQLRGLNPEDTVAAYTDGQGRRWVTPSNRVCVCVPRFASLRQEIMLARFDSRLRTAQQATKRNLEMNGEVQRVLAHLQAEGVNAYWQRTRVSIAEQRTNLDVVARIVGVPGILKGTLAPDERTGICQTPPKPLFDKPLVLKKSTDKDSAQLGEVVTFTIRFSNVGDRPIADVVIADSLTARLEYVPDSAESDRAAVFTTQENEAGSVIVRWQVQGLLQPGETGTVRFQVRVR